MPKTKFGFVSSAPAFGHFFFLFSPFGKRRSPFPFPPFFFNCRQFCNRLLRLLPLPPPQLICAVEHIRSCRIWEPNWSFFSAVRVRAKAISSGKVGFAAAEIGGTQIRNGSLRFLPCWQNQKLESCSEVLLFCCTQNGESLFKKIYATQPVRFNFFPSCCVRGAQKFGEVRMSFGDDQWLRPRREVTREGLKRGGKCLGWLSPLSQINVAV